LWKRRQRGLEVSQVLDLRRAGGTVFDVLSHFGFALGREAAVDEVGQPFRRNRVCGAEAPQP
jgi:hypothetical protein